MPSDSRRHFAHKNKKIDRESRLLHIAIGDKEKPEFTYLGEWAEGISPSEREVSREIGLQRRRLLFTVPSVKLSESPIGVYQLLDSMVNTLNVIELKKLATEAGVKIKETDTVSTVLEAIRAANAENKIFDLLSPEQLLRVKKELEKQVAEFKEFQGTDLWKGGARSILSYQTIEQIQDKEAELASKRELQEGKALAETEEEPDNRISSFEEWFDQPSVSVQDVIKELSLNPSVKQDLEKHMPKGLTEAQKETERKRRLKAALMSMKRLYDKKNTWNAYAVMRNSELQRFSEERHLQFPDVQKELYKETEKTLLPLEGMIREKAAEEAKLAQEWLDKQKAYCEKKYGMKFPDTGGEIEIGKMNEQVMGVFGISADSLWKEFSMIQHQIDRARGKDEKGDSIELEPVGKLPDLCTHLEKVRTQRAKIEVALKQLRTEQEEVTEWARGAQGEIDELLTQYPTEEEKQAAGEKVGDPEIFGFLQEVQTDLASPVGEVGANAYHYPPKRREKIEKLTTVLSAPALVAAVAETKTLTETPVKASVSAERIDKVVNNISDLPILQQGAFNLLGVSQQFLALGVRLKRYLERGAGAALEKELKKLEATYKALKEVQDRKNIALGHPPRYNRDDRKIYLDTGRLGGEGSAKYESTLAHEQVHSVIHILTEGAPKSAPVFVGFLAGTYKEAQKRNPKLEEMLFARAEKWISKEQLEKVRAECGGNELMMRKKLRDPLFEEALAHYMTSVQDPTRAERYKKDAEIFKHFDPSVKGEGEKAAVREYFQDVPDAPDMDAIMRGEGGGGAPTETPSVGTIQEDFTLIKANILKMEKFSETYPEHAAALAPHLSDCKKFDKELYDVLRKKEWNGQKIPVPEEHEPYTSAVSELKNFSGEIIKEIDNFDNEERDLSDVGREGGLKAIWNNMYWMSALDIYFLVKDAKDDVVRMWERRSKHGRSKVGQLLFGWVPENDIPGLRYMGRLGKENEKREEEAENEEVNVWKEALQTKDPYVLMGIMDGTSNKDQIKAIFILLSEKGRINWGDHRVWHALNRLSKLPNMPEAECEYDIHLRDRWLNKHITDIWRDKDLYLTWKSGNDSAYASGKEKYTNMVDTYANTRTMDKMLARQLELWHDHKPNPPEEVNPHLYEELLDYAMRNGKMSMEAKFFYLIRGISEGLLPLERLTIMNAKVLQDFPFFDYFTSHNNTLYEINALSDSLIESPANRYEPGTKTTLFLQFQLARDEDTRSRVEKIMARDARNIDHEDIPMLLAFLDAGGWKDILQPASGALQRLTPEGMKNAYVGFHTLFKSYAILAELDKQGKQAFTQNDANNLAQKIAAYVYFDSTVTGKANEGGLNRPELSWHQINNTSMPSSSYTKTPKYFRDKMNNFVGEVVSDYGIEDEQLAEGVQLKDWIPNAENDGRHYTNEDKQKLGGTREQFVEKLVGAIMADPSKFTQRLIANEGNFDDLSDMNVNNVSRSLASAA